MFWKKYRGSNPKEAILRSIYIDNLRFAGKRIEDDRPTKQVFVRKLIRILALVLAFCVSPGLELSLSLDAEFLPSPHVEAELALTSLPPPHVEPDEAFSFTEPDSLWHPPLADPGHSGLHVQGSNFSETDHHELMDYSLLISRNDQVRLLSLFGLDVKKIVIDPGHGGVDSGAIGTMGTKEKDITLDVALRLRDRLRRIGIENVLLTRESDRTVSLAKRVEFAKENQADLFISVHVNSLPNQSLNTIETYYFGPPLNAETLRLAEQENRESHFSIGELNAIIQDIGNTVKRQESRRLASAIQKSLFKNVKRYDAQVLDWGIKMAPFVVLSKVNSPSVLVEISCLSKEEEEAKLALPEYREKIASFLEEGIVHYLAK